VDGLSAAGNVIGGTCVHVVVTLLRQYAVLDVACCY